LPRNQAEGDIPKIAIPTGALDSFECVLRKIGIDDSEFTAATGTGRIHLYAGAGSPGASPNSGAAASENTLVGSQSLLNSYDAVLFPCQGSQYDKTTTQKQTLINYANAGGRVLATHYSYVWLYNAAPFSQTANWSVDGSGVTADPQLAYVDTSFSEGLQLAQWLMTVGASNTLGEILLGTLRSDFTDVIPPSQLWLTVNDPTSGTMPLLYDFETPVGVPPAQQCGRVMYSDFHVADNYVDPTMKFPSECAPGAMTPGEKLMEHMLFELTSCIDQ
jgi:hypothetical protein